MSHIRILPHGPNLWNGIQPDLAQKRSKKGHWSVNYCDSSGAEEHDFAWFALIGFWWRVKADKPSREMVQGGAPKIAKLVYKSNNYGL